MMKYWKFLVLGLTLGMGSLCLPLRAQIVAAEYFFDTDPGFGNAAPITLSGPADTLTGPLFIDPSGLAPGLHTLYLRFRNDSSRWSVPLRRPFYLAPAPVSLDPGATYALDALPGPGMGSPFTLDFSLPNSPSRSRNQLSVPIDGLAPGLHTFYLRVSQGGQPGFPQRGRFYLSDATASPALTQAEYFVDVDPGLGAAMAIDLPLPPPPSLTDSLRLAISDTLGLGTHRLYLRFKNDSLPGGWSLPVGQDFEVQTAQGLDADAFATLHLYPNPTSDVVQVQFDAGRLLGYQLIDSRGRVLAQGFAGPVDLRPWPTGVYLLRLDTSRGRVTRQVIKH